MSSCTVTVTVGLLQMQASPEPQVNLERAVDGIRGAARQGAQIICLQELFTSRYFCQTEDHRFFELAETVPAE